MVGVRAPRQGLMEGQGGLVEGEGRGSGPGGTEVGEQQLPPVGSEGSRRQGGGPGAVAEAVPDTEGGNAHEGGWPRGTQPWPDRESGAPSESAPLSCQG